MSIVVIPPTRDLKTKTLMINEVKIDIEQLNAVKLTPNEYCVLLWLHSRDYKSLCTFFNVLNNFQQFERLLSSLESMNYITWLGEREPIALMLEKERFDGIETTVRTVELLFKDDQTKLEKALMKDTFNRCWDELKATYPRKEGSRPLHNNGKWCIKHYRKRIEEAGEQAEEFHAKVIKGIKNEIESRRRSSLKREWREPWKLMTTYLNQSGWEMYQDGEDNIAISDYGAEEL